MDNSKLRRRLHMLEQHAISEPVTLVMPDGRTEILRGSAPELLGRAWRGERGPGIGLIARSISSVEPGGGHLIDLARAILNSPLQ